MKILAKKPLADTGTDVDDSGDFFDGKIPLQVGVNPGQQLFDPFILKGGGTLGGKLGGKLPGLLPGEKKDLGEGRAHLEFISVRFQGTGIEGSVKILKKWLVFRYPVEFQESRTFFQKGTDIAGVKDTAWDTGDNARIEDKRMVAAGGRDKTGKRMEDLRIDETAFTGKDLVRFTADADVDFAFQKEKDFQLPVPVGGNQAGSIKTDIAFIGNEVKRRMFQLDNFSFIRIHRYEGAVLYHGEFLSGKSFLL